MGNHASDIYFIGKPLSKYLSTSILQLGVAALLRLFRQTGTQLPLVKCFICCNHFPKHKPSPSGSICPVNANVRAQFLLEYNQRPNPSTSTPTFAHIQLALWSYPAVPHSAAAGNIPTLGGTSSVTAADATGSNSIGNAAPGQPLLSNAHLSSVAAPGSTAAPTSTIVGSSSLSMGAPLSASVFYFRLLDDGIQRGYALPVASFSCTLHFFCSCPDYASHSAARVSRRFPALSSVSISFVVIPTPSRTLVPRVSAASTRGSGSPVSYRCRSCSRPVCNLSSGLTSRGHSSSLVHRRGQRSRPLPACADGPPCRLPMDMAS